jgi:hypothetical protein
MNQGDTEHDDTRQQDQEATEPGVHNDSVVHRVADGHKAIICHNSKKLSIPANVYEKYS